MSTESEQNLALWRSVEQTDPRRTKAFQGKGGFKGTAISPMYLIKRATELWGPMGDRWGIRIVQEREIKGCPMVVREKGENEGQVVGEECVHLVQAELFYPGPSGKEATIPCFGQTTIVGQYKAGGMWTDEEAPKKGLTDALTKALSWLGFAADVHMGLFDDSKYVNRVLEETERKEQEQTNGDLRKATLATLTKAAEGGIRELEIAWGRLTNPAKASVKDLMPGLKEKATKEGANAAAGSN